MSKPLYKRIELPQLNCKPNCGECCGVVPCTEAEYAAVEQYASEHGVIPKAQGLTCPFYQEGGCAVYEIRPFPCRFFGHVEEMPCPHGINVNVPSSLKRKLDASYPKPTRCLHELLPGGYLSAFAAEPQ